MNSHKHCIREERGPCPWGCGSRCQGQGDEEAQTNGHRKKLCVWALTFQFEKKENIRESVCLFIYFCC